MHQSILIQNLQGHKTKRIPIWFMRQAGRYLPEYRAVRANTGSFLDLCFDPKNAAEVTLQPLRRFDLDAAIIFSDILVIPYALGQKVDFVVGEGPKLDPIHNRTDLKNLVEDEFEKLLAPVYEALKIVRDELPKDKALIGFAGAPWTIASYMIEGRGGHDFSKIKSWAHDDPDGFQDLMDILCRTISSHLINQIDAGADLLQLFESWAGVLTGDDFNRWVIQPISKIVTTVQAAKPDTPIIVFPRTDNQDDLMHFAKNVSVAGISLGQGVDAHWAAKNLPESLCLQGNLNPETLLSGGLKMDDEAAHICQNWQERPYIFNLGHGIIKETNPENVTRLIATIRAQEEKIEVA